MPRILRFTAPLLPTNQTPQMPSASTGVLADDHAVFMRPRAATTLALHLLEPALTAWGTTRLLQAGKAAAAGESPIAALTHFLVASMVLPGVVSAGANVTQKMWLQQVQLTYDEAFIAHDSNRPALWAMHKGEGEANQRAVRTHLFAERLRWGIFNEVNSSCDLSRAALQVGIGMVLFAATLGWDVTVALALSAAMVGTFGHRHLAATVQRSEAANKASGALFEHRKRIWDNVLLGNVNNDARWQTRYDELAAAQHKVATLTANHNVQRDLQVMGLAMLPIAVTLFARLLLLNDVTTRSSAARDVILQLPHLLNVTSRLVGLSELLTGKFLPARASFANTLKSARQTPQLDVRAHMRRDDISVTHNGHTRTLDDAWTEMLRASRQGTGGRFTIRGDNGAGKSMALIDLQQELLRSGDSMLVPANLADLAFEMRNGSTGERCLDALAAAIAHGPPTLLLDEWEAHLDSDNRNKLNARLSQLSQATEANGKGGRTIIEVSHQPRDTM